MFSAAARVLSEFSPALNDPDGPLFPPLEKVREVSYRVAVAVGAEAVRAGLTSLNLAETRCGRLGKATKAQKAHHEIGRSSNLTRAFCASCGLRMT